jgi:hypothetical protein
MVKRREVQRVVTGIREQIPEGLGDSPPASKRMRMSEGLTDDELDEFEMAQWRRRQATEAFCAARTVQPLGVSAQTFLQAHNVTWYVLHNTPEKAAHLTWWEPERRT